ncbi:PucR family transcriptional regulator [Kutzneria sp. NPDC052558]|uniref:PucR family transcriptional regulator n=1 Tax=Kutzneria sp. NPDC052558 TaxID=3364121 RepID=UPI0037C7728B
MTEQPHAPRSVIREVAAVVLADLPSFADRLSEMGAVREERIYARNGKVPKADMWKSFHDNGRSVLLLVTRGFEDEREWLDPPLATGRRRAEQGVPLESVLHLFRLGGTLLWEMLLAEARRRSPAELEEFVDGAMLLWEAIDRISVAMVDSYRTWQAEIRRRANRRKERLVGALIGGRGVDPTVAADAETELNLSARGRYVVVLSAGEEAEEDLRAAQSCLAVHGMQSVWLSRGERVVWLVELAAAGPARVAELLTPHLRDRAGMSGVVDGFAELGVGYQLAETALLTQPGGAAGIAVLDDRLPEALVVSSPQLSQRLAARTLGRVLELDAPEREMLLDTLETWFRAERSAGRTGTLLYCHRNTVLNRLRKVELLTGKSLEDDRHQLACRLALMAYRTLLR